MFRRSIRIFCFAMLILPACGCPAAEHSKDSLDKVRSGLADGEAVLVDVREQSEWDAGHIADAILVPLSQLREGVDQSRLDKDKTLYLYCRSGNRVRYAADILTPLGYDAQPLPWGYSELVKKGFKNVPPKER